MPANLINKFDELMDLVTNNPIISSAVAVGGIAVCGMLGYCLWSRRKSSQRLHPRQNESLITRTEIINGKTGTGYYGKTGKNSTGLRQHDSKKQGTTTPMSDFWPGDPPWMPGAHDHDHHDDTCPENRV